MLPIVEAANEGTFDMAIKFRKGDVVTVRAVVRHNCEDDENSVAVDINGAYDAVWPLVQDVTMIQQQIVIGDRVKFTIPVPGEEPQGLDGLVLAISNDHAWIDIGGGDYCTRTLTSVERVES